MTTLADLMDVAALARQIDSGLIRRVVSPDGRHALYTYTDRAAYSRTWTPETRQCRGLIERISDGLIVCRTFDKFFNYGEPEADALPDWKAVRVTAKLDGSLIALWYDGDAPIGSMTSKGWRCTTRGSFDSAQAQAAQAWVDRRVQTLNLTVGQTYLCEWTAPENRVVLAYEESGLNLLSVRDNATGFEEIEPFMWPRCGLIDVGQAFATSLDQVLGAAHTSTGVEGWVLSWYRSPAGAVGRVKIKTDEYLKLHKLIAGFSVERVREQLLAGTLDAYLASLPDEIHKQGEHIAIRVQLRATRRELRIRRMFGELRSHLTESRKAFALALQTYAAPEDRPLLFALADGREISADILRTLDLADLEARAELEPA